MTFASVLGVSINKRSPGGSYVSDLHTQYAQIKTGAWDINTKNIPSSLPSGYNWGEFLWIPTAYESSNGEFFGIIIISSTIGSSEMKYYISSKWNTDWGVWHEL